MGNFPESCELHAICSTGGVDWSKDLDQTWTQILPRTKLGPHRRHFFHLENVQGREYTHVKMTIHPDGGVKRIRIIGRKVDRAVSGNSAIGKTITQVSDGTDSSSSPKLAAAPILPSNTLITVLPLTPEAFAPFGQVIQAYADQNAAPRGTRITPANQGSASKFHKLALLASSYAPEVGATSGLSVYRCKPLKGIGNDGTCVLEMLERHPFTNQAFIPMGESGVEGGDGLNHPGNAYLVVVAKDGPDDKPDLKTLRAFVATAAQGIMYNTGVWRQCYCSLLSNVMAIMLTMLRRSTDDCPWKGASWLRVILDTKLTKVIFR